ncbi:LysR family transcriptional regulator [Orrella sp. JC864]|uniref:LysR family transcriptional regulator n=1 Tax=Orrella sp. JC864 TaxID=3120298 RepID=UPI00300A9509
MIRNLSLRHLRCFVAVAEAGSFTVAASRLFLTQSSLTATIQQFEEAVGVRLFDRTTRRVTMTREAQRFKAEAERILSQFDGAISDLQAFSQGRQGQLRVAAPVSVMDLFLADAIHAFRKLHPNVTLALRDAGAQMVETMVSNGQIDFAVTSRHKGLEDLIYTPLFEDRYGVVCDAAHPLAGRSGPLPWSALDPAGHVCFSADTGIYAYLREHSGQPAFFEGSHDEVSSTNSLHALLRHGDRYAILPALVAHSVGYSGYVFRELKGPRLSREVCLVTRKLRALSPSAEMLLALIGETMAKKPLTGVRVLHGKMPRRGRAAAGAGKLTRS